MKSMRADPNLITTEAGELLAEIEQSQTRNGAIELPAAKVAQLKELLKKVMKGVTLEPEMNKKELSTVEAARILNVSHTYLVKLLDAGTLPHRKMGKHRRIRKADVLEYKKRDDERRSTSLDELAEFGQEHDMGYNK